MAKRGRYFTSIGRKHWAMAKGSFRRSVRPDIEGIPLEARSARHGLKPKHGAWSLPYQALIVRNRTPARLTFERYSVRNKTTVSAIFASVLSWAIVRDTR